MISGLRESLQSKSVLGMLERCVYIVGRKLVHCYMCGVSASMLVVFHTIRWGVLYALTLLYIILPRKLPLC
jgi:hypothetical protein